MDFTKIPEHHVTSIGETERKVRRSKQRIVGAVLAVILGATAWYVVATRAAASAERAKAEAADAGMKARVGQLERDYRAAVAGGQVDAKALGALDQAITTERERQGLARATRREDQRFLEQLETERDDWLARAAVPRLLSLEASAEGKREAGQLEAAAEDLRAALALQRAINGSSAAARVKDYVRETRLAQALTALEVEPQRREVRVALERAAAAAQRQQWVETRVAYLEARAAQVALNQKYPGTRFADTPAINRIDQELASLQGADDAAEIVALTQRGEAAAMAGRSAEAAAAYGAAKDLQAKLNRLFARSQFASANRWEDLEARQQAMAAAGALAELKSSVDEIEAALRQRNVIGASTSVSAALRRLDEIERTWPRAASVVLEMKRRLAYLNLRRADLGAIQAAVLGRLEPLPGVPRVSLLTTEVTQALYMQVMNTNPSRNEGRALPVDSVSWRDAGDFCERLGWVLGRWVRLPTETEWRTALGRGNAGAAAWTWDTSGGQSREAGKSSANTAGFFDLAGNLAEWLEPAEAKSAVAPVAGGSFLDDAATVEALPVVPLDKGERLRNVGFRVAVENAR